MMLRGVRGGTTVTDNDAGQILAATKELLEQLIRVNAIEEEAVASVLFTTTPDLNAAFPAAAARDLGWHRCALMGFQEIQVPNGIQYCIRVLIHWNTDKTLDEIKHVYMHGAMKLRPDLYPDNRVELNGGTA
ncbi:MAG: chorismate mutase [bacterium]|nr:chorismate mutase [bacterium]